MNWPAQSHKRKAPDWRGGTLLGFLNNELSKSFPAKNDGRGNGMYFWPAQSRNPELQSNGIRSFDWRTVLFGQAIVKTLKEMLLNVIVIEKNKKNNGIAYFMVLQVVSNKQISLPLRWSKRFWFAFWCTKSNRCSVRRLLTYKHTK